MDSQAVMFMLQGGLSLLLLLLGIVINAMRGSVERVSTDLKILNDAVLGRYVTTEVVNTQVADLRKEQQVRFEESRRMEHELRSMIQVLQVEMAKTMGKTYAEYSKGRHE